MPWDSPGIKPSITPPAPSHATKTTNPSTNTMYPFNAEKAVELFFELYAVLVNLAYIPFDDLSFPPHQLPPSRVARLGPTIDPIVLDLVKNLPYLKGRHGSTVAPGTVSKDLSLDLYYALHPMEWADGEYEYVERWSLCLTDGQDGWCSGWLILDIMKGSLVLWLLSFFSLSRGLSCLRPLSFWRLTCIDV